MQRTPGFPFAPLSSLTALGAMVVAAACTASSSSQVTGGTGAMAGVGGTAGVGMGAGGQAFGGNAGSGVGGTPSGGIGQGGTGLGGVGGLGGTGTAGSAGTAGTGATSSTDMTPAGDGFYLLEDLDRGVVAMSVNGGVFIGWRMLGPEYDRDNPANVSYDVYRDGSKIANVTDSTNYLDPEGSAASEYSVGAVIGGAAGPVSAPIGVWGQNYLSVPLESPSDDRHHASDGSAADLDGDGQLELVLKWEANNSQDNANSGVTDNVYLDGLELDGTRRWRIDLGRNIRAGAHYTQFIAYDLDGDGKAELSVKTAPGTRDATGEYLRLGPAANDDDEADHRQADGYVLSGPEYFTVFSGETGEELATVNFEVARGVVDDWGDDYGNRVDRFLATAAHLDDTGVASVIMARGYYTRSTLTAWNFRDGQLTRHWQFDSDGSGNSFTNQGAHSLSVANADDDKGQEIIYGAMTVDHDGRGICATGFNHGDALHVSDFVPSRPGLEAFMPHENSGVPLWSLRDPGTCEVIQRGVDSSEDVGRGVAADVDPSNPGAEMWASRAVPFMSATTAQTVGTAPAQINFLIWWDADESRELEDEVAITKYGGEELLRCSSCASNNGTKATPVLVADLLGDWREEVIWREANNSALRIYSTTDISSRRIYTLMHDPQYRVAISWQNVAYNQPPHPSFHIGNGMEDPPMPDIHVR